MTADGAAVCAATISQPYKSEYVRGTPNFQAPGHLNGSSITGRLAYDQAFLSSELFTESFAAMADDTKSALGYALTDLVLYCTYNGLPCALEKLDFALNWRYNVGITTQNVNNNIVNNVIFFILIFF